MIPRKTHANFCKEVYGLVGEEYTILGQYINAKTKIKIQHNKCHYIYDVTPDGFFKGRRCPQCNQDFAKSTDQFKNEVYQLVNDEYIVISDYKNNKTKVQLQHNIDTCNHIFSMLPNAFLRGEKCPVCAQKIKAEKRKYTIEKIKHFVEVESKSGCKLDTDIYVGYKKKLRVLCSDCGKPYLVSFDNFVRKQKYRCNKCQKVIGSLKQADTIESVIEFVKNNSSSKLLSDKYENAHQKLLFECECGNNFITTMNSFKTKHKRQCNECTSSKGEKEIARYLKQNYISFIPEFKFIDCKNYRQLPFDFAIFDVYSNLSYLIEYQGPHHYKPTRFNGISLEIAKENFLRTIKNDKIKNDYCLKNNIKLIKIPYGDFKNINAILDNILSGGDDNGYIAS